MVNKKSPFYVIWLSTPLKKLAGQQEKQQNNRDTLFSVTVIFT